MIGLCTCIREPRGEHGLEGFNIGDSYQYEVCENDLGVVYYRIYHRPDYYETATPPSFRRFFTRGDADGKL